MPTAEAAFRAELVVKTMFELTAVRNELFVSELVEPRRSPLRIENRPKQMPEIVPPKLPEPRSMSGAPGVLTGSDKKRPAEKNRPTLPPIVPADPATGPGTISTPSPCDPASGPKDRDR